MGTTKTRADNISMLKRWTKNVDWDYDFLIAQLCIHSSVTMRLAKEYLKILIDCKYVRFDKKSRKIFPVKFKEK